MRKRSNPRFNRAVDVVCGAIIVTLLAIVAIANLFQFNRPTVSESENRTLATMPAFSVKTLFDGSYFKNISLFISDTFIGRDSLVQASKKLDTLKGVSFSVADGDFALLQTPTTPIENEEDTEMKDLLQDALNKLENNDTINTEDKTEDNVIDEETVFVDPNADAEDVEKIEFIKDEVALTVGSGISLKVVIEPAVNPEHLKWDISDDEVVTISFNEKGGINLKATKAGECIVKAMGGQAEASFKVKVSEIASVTQNQNADNADFLTDGLFIYGDAVYTQGAFSQTNAKNYLDTALYYKNLFGSNTTVSVVIAPVSSMIIDNPEITKMIPDQKAAMDSMKALCNPAVNFVDTYSELYNHKDEYLYFKTDHHWTARGAYYAYSAFAKSLGLTPTPLDDFDYVLRNEHYQGSMYQYTQDARVRNFSDLVEEFIPRKEHTMTITTKSGSTEYYNTSIVSFNDTYVAFIAGDNPYTVINVPENPQDKNVLVLKDSFGNAFAPFLCEHFGNIIIVDTRYSSFNIYDQLKDYGITDIVLVNNIQAANSPAWSRLYLAAVGVQ